MLSGIQNAQVLVVLILGLLALGLEVYALVDAVRQRADAFTAAGKLTKPLWVTFLSIATAIGFVTFRNPLGGASIFTIIGVVAAGVYLADVRPALRSVSGGGGSSGPYGRW
jgi:hypothetical protein